MDLLWKKNLNRINWFQYIILNSESKEITRFLNRKKLQCHILYTSKHLFSTALALGITLQISCHLCIFCSSNLFILRMSRSTLIISRLMITCKLLFLFLTDLTCYSFILFMRKDNDIPPPEK